MLTLVFKPFTICRTDMIVSLAHASFNILAFADDRDVQMPAARDFQARQRLIKVTWVFEPGFASANICKGS